MKRKGKYVQLELPFKPWDDEVKCVSLAPYCLFQREVWKDIVGYEGLYQASNLGRIRSFYKPHGKLRKVPKILKQRLSNKGYPMVNLSKNGKAKKYSVHRLVYEAFIGKIPEGMQVNHKDENKQNNVLSNIDTLMSPKQNSNWGTRNERVAKANRLVQKNGKTKSKSVIQKSLQGEIIKIWASAHEIQRTLGFGQGNISACCRGGFYRKGKWKNYTQSYGYRWEYEEAV